MKRKNLIVKRRVKKKGQLIKDLKIKKIFSKFKSTIYKKTSKNNFAIAVSGGSDSLCLAYFSKIYSTQFKNQIHVLIVDHKLRKESSKEALKVKRILKKKNIQSKILSWRGVVPKSNIQLNARNIRYSLIHDYCRKKNLKYLITAHHMDDQIENFFIRLFRGSGLTGLSSMSEISTYSNNLEIIRPFLSLKKEDLRHITLKYFKTYILDPSNDNEKFMRIRIRKYRENMEKEGLSTDKIIKTINNLLSANQAINFYKKKALFKYVTFTPKNNCLINEEIFYDESTEIVFKCFSDILSLISATYYPPRSKKIINLIKRLKNDKFTKSTLGGCIIEKKDSFISVSKETRGRKI
jgi:tRNA(Ile)-lysidine synthase